MKIYSIAIISRELKIISDLTSFGFFSKKYVEEYLKFTSNLLADKTKDNSRLIVDLNTQQISLPIKGSCLSDSKSVIVIISTREYPQRILNDLLFRLKYESELFNNETLKKWQDINQIDKITKIQNELDDVKEIMVQNIESVLDRGEKIENLVEKSLILSDHSKKFFKSAQKINRCCSLY